MPETAKKVSPASAFIPNVDGVSVAKAFLHQVVSPNSDNADQGLFQIAQQCLLAGTMDEGTLKTPTP